MNVNCNQTKTYQNYRMLLGLAVWLGLELLDKLLNFLWRCLICEGYGQFEPLCTEGVKTYGHPPGISLQLDLNQQNLWPLQQGWAYHLWVEDQRRERTTVKCQRLLLGVTGWYFLQVHSRKIILHVLKHVLVHFNDLFAWRHNSLRTNLLKEACVRLEVFVASS